MHRPMSVHNFLSSCWLLQPDSKYGVILMKSLYILLPGLKFFTKTSTLENHTKPLETHG